MEAWRVILGIGVVAVFGYVTYASVKRHRKVDQLLDRMSDRLDLNRARVSSAPWAADTIEVAQGKRQGIPVTVHFAPSVGERQQAITTVTLEWPALVSSGVTLDRMSTLTESALVRKIPVFARDTISVGLRTIDFPWFGLCSAYGSDEELARVFNPPVRALLDRLPVRIAVVSLHDQMLRIEWLGVKEDPAVVELAFHVGIDVLSLLSPRR
jgi:hypothetical protein